MNTDTTLSVGHGKTTEKPLSPHPQSSFRTWIEKQSGQDISHCYQCGRCTAGCPVAYRMDLGPRRVMRSLQLGLKDEAIRSNSIWFCVSCQTCSARCPKEIDIARIMEAVRIMAVQERIKPAKKDIALFHQLFLDNVRSLGRVNELLLGGLYNLRSGHLTQDLEMFFGMVPRGKISFIPRRVKGAAELGAVFQRARALREKEGI